VGEYVVESMVKNSSGSREENQVGQTLFNLPFFSFSSVLSYTAHSLYLIPFLTFVVAYIRRKGKDEYQEVTKGF